METESKAWIPEVGKTAWVVSENRVKEVMVLKEPIHGSNLHFVQDDRIKFSIGKLFPTPEAALASIKIYDLEGKEVLIPRAELQYPKDEVESRALRIMLTDEAGMLNYSWEQCLAMARREIGVGAAICGKSDETELGSEIKYVAKPKKPWSDFDGDRLHRFLRDEAGQSENVWDVLTKGLPRVKPIPMRTDEELNAMLSPDGNFYMIEKREFGLGEVPLLET